MIRKQCDKKLHEAIDKHTTKEGKHKVKARGQQQSKTVSTISRSPRSQDFYGISTFYRDFKISYGFQDLNEISQDLTQIL